MKRSHIVFLSLVALVCAAFVLNEAAEAASRMGGGKSFGSSPSYQRSAPAPSPGAGSPATSPGISRPAPTASPSPMGRWGGMLGGMLMGGLIGSLLFGGGHAWGGPSLIDIALIGGGLFLLFRFLRSRREATQTAGSPGAYSFDRGTAQGWGASGVDPAASAPAESPAPIPADFDQGEFLKGARLMYNRLQAAWDRRDLADIRQFASDEVYEEIRRQAQESPAPTKTELLLVNPRLLEVRDTHGRTVASVLYDVMMREHGEERANQVREIWHFSRAAGDAKAFWVLEGIQQVEG
ncbi:MAG: TIM44-like domain-containing protein [Desulfobacterales bacterium]|jgi:predicted lipid-binding transport protein (Tim44 family)|nr:TIM44-like domain-containing protein [Desulfobacterales bacterium]